MSDTGSALDSTRAQWPLPDHERRRFLKKTAAALSGAYLGFYSPRLFGVGTASSASNMKFRPLGATGFDVSEVSFGGYAVRDPNVVRYALDKGINYFDTAWDYTDGVSEQTIGTGLAGRRDEAVLTTKWHPWKDTTTDEMMEMLNQSLKRLKTDHVDMLLVHQVGKRSGGQGIERLQNQELFKAMERAKQQGKARYFGCSGHDPDLMDVMNYAVDIPDFNVLLCRYSYKAYPDQDELFQKAQSKGMGVVAMKTLGGARGEDLRAFEGSGTTRKQAALKWVLSNKHISNLIITMSSNTQVDEYVQASGVTVV